MAGTGKAHLRDDADVLLRVEDLVVEFPVGRTGLKVNAVSGISLMAWRGEKADREACKFMEADFGKILSHLKIFAAMNPRLATWPDTGQY